MSLPRYGAYKATDTELKDIPSHWRLVRARAIGQFSSSGIDKKSVDGEQPVRMLNYLDVYRSADKVLRYSDDLMTTTAAKDKASEHAVREGDILITPSSETPDDIGHAACVADMPDGVVYSYHLVRYRLAERADARYLVYLLNAHPTRRYFASVCTGTTRQVLVRDDLRNTPLCLPPLSEQSAIAAFLDHETGKIDALIAEQEKLLALLAEKRQATISHAVTRGLDPAVRLKDSGIPWLGQVPVHWDIMPLARITLEKCDGPFGSGIKSDHYTDEGALVIRLQNIRQSGYHTGDAAYLDIDYFNASLKRHSVAPGDLLIAGLGDERNLVGRACVAPDNLGPALVKADCFRFRLIDAANASFVAAQLNASASFDAGTMATGTTRSRIPLSAMGSRVVALPPWDEQTAVVAHIDRATRRTERLMSEARDAIALLGERRAALITAAVTGQIDVRGAAV